VCQGPAEVDFYVDGALLAIGAQLPTGHYLNHITVTPMVCLCNGPEGHYITYQHSTCRHVLFDF
jgi:hypothetical protein